MRALQLSLLLVALELAACRCDPLAPAAAPSSRPDVEHLSSRLDPPPREEGPPRVESREQLERTRREAAELVASLRAGGVPAREVASVADIRGYRLFRRRSYGQALAWFDAALSAEPGHELALLNAARAARLLGDDERARRHLLALEQLGTSLARALLRRAARDRDLAGFSRARRSRD